MDIDDFKSINNSFGHYMGDRVIIHFIDIINSFIRKDIDFLERYGGDEFILLIAHCPNKNDHKVAVQILVFLNNKPLL